MASATSLLLALSVSLAYATAAPRQAMMRLTDVLVFTPYPQNPPGSHDGLLFAADRGNRKGQFLVVQTGEAPRAGASGVSSEYRLIGGGAVGPLPDVDVLGIHYIKVRPDRRDAFEAFVRDTLHPAVGNLRPDLRLLYYKGTAGPDAGSYITIFALTRASRDKYWPGGSDSEELRSVFKPVQRLTTELSTFLVEGSALTDPKFAAAIFESREWTDFVLAAPASR